MTKVKKAEKAASATATKKVKKNLNAQTDSKNVKQTVKKVVESEREVKYKYPETMAKDPIEKKKFRAQARAKEKSFLKQLDDNRKDPKALEKINKDYRKFRNETYLVPEKA